MKHGEFFSIQTIVKQSTGQTYLELNSLIAYLYELRELGENQGQKEGITSVLVNLQDLRDRKAEKQKESQDETKGPGFFARLFGF